LYSADCATRATGVPHSLQNFAVALKGVPHDPQEWLAAVRAPPPFPALSTSVSCHRWSDISAISQPTSQTKNDGRLHSTICTPIETGDSVQLLPIRTTNASQGFQGLWRPTAWAQQSCDRTHEYGELLGADAM